MGKRIEQKVLDAFFGGGAEKTLEDDAGQAPQHDSCAGPFGPFGGMNYVENMLGGLRKADAEVDAGMDAEAAGPEAQ